MEETENGWDFVPDISDILLELDWDGNVVWRWQEGDLHHGMARMPNGNTLIIIWTPLPDGFHQRIKGGIAPETWEKILEKDPEFGGWWQAQIGRPLR